MLSYSMGHRYKSCRRLQKSLATGSGFLFIYLFSKVFSKHVTAVDADFAELSEIFWLLMKLTKWVGMGSKLTRYFQRVNPFNTLLIVA